MPAIIRRMQTYHRTSKHAGCSGTRRALSLILCASLATACASGPAIVPVYPMPSVDAGAEQRANAAASSVAGVRMVARVGTWRGRPERLDAVIPLEVEISNNGERPVSIRYEQFALLSDTGKRLAALPPFDIRATEIEPIPISNGSGFQIAPYHRAFLPSYEEFPGAFPEDIEYFEAHYSALRVVGLPTPEMIRAALPEGVLLPGGRIAGFLYLERLGDDATGAIFEFELAESPKSRSFGRINIPFRVPE